eukprot:9474531-Pyramimonas_sp.AAC.2
MRGHLFSAACTAAKAENRLRPSGCGLRCIVSGWGLPQKRSRFLLVRPPPHSLDDAYGESPPPPASVRLMRGLVAGIA